MGYLVLAILSSFSISLLVKDNETHGANTEVVLASNYVTAGAIGWAFLLLQPPGSTGSRLSMSTTTLLLGLGGSLLWPGAFYLHMWGIRRYGMSLAGSVARLSLTIPILFALLVLGEVLTLLTALGIVSAFAAFVLLSPFRKPAADPATQSPGTHGRASETADRSTLDRSALWYFPTLLIVFGCVDLWANLFNTLAPGSERFIFVVLIFTGSGLLTWSTVLARRTRLDRGSILRGLLLGVPNFFSTFFLVESLRAPALRGHSAIVYAIYSAAGVILAFVAGSVFWKEPLTGRNRWGVTVAVAAVALLNLG